MAVHVLGVVALVCFYVLILIVGIWAGRKSGRASTVSEQMTIAGRNIGLLIGVFTMTATFVGGAYINGIAEVIYTEHGGLVWCQAPFGYAISLALNAAFFADKMRSRGYVTMLDPFQLKFGERTCGLLFVPALMADVLWLAAILVALGATLSVILDIGFTVTVVASAFVAVTYTLLGGLLSVAYTDIVQLLLMFFGLWTVVPFAFTHESMDGRGIFSAIGDHHEDKNWTEVFDNATATLTDGPAWLGRVEGQDIGSWVDTAFLFALGGIPWQVYFQRVLALKSSRAARLSSYLAAVGCFMLGMPPLLIGAVARTADWTKTDLSLSSIPILAGDEKLILPMVMQYLCPPAVTFLGLGAVSAAVMSSADSSMLSVSSMFVHNVYKPIFRHKAAERELVWVMRFSILAAGVAAAVIGIFVQSTYALWFLSADVVYVTLFSQLTCVVYLDWVNTYGSLLGFVVGVVLRVLGGDATLGIPAVIRYTGFEPAHQYGENGQTISVPEKQRFPYKTLTMLVSFATIVSVSYATKLLFERRVLSKRWDVFRCFEERSNESLEMNKQDKLLRQNQDGANGHEPKSRDQSPDQMEPREVDQVKEVENKLSEQCV